MMVYKETTGSVFPADFFIQSGDQPAVVQEDLGKEMCYMYREVSIFDAEEPCEGSWIVLRSLSLNGYTRYTGSLPKEEVPNYIQALRDEEFAFEGKIFGREIPGQVLEESHYGCFRKGRHLLPF
jgi:hypothetical protein